MVHKEINPQPGTVKWVEIGSGGEACCQKGNPNELEGIGGTLKVEKPLAAVKRVNHMSTSQIVGEGLFLKHLCAKILDDHFVAEGVYDTSHVTSPLGSFPGGYYYEYAVGSDGFYWEDTELSGYIKFTNNLSNAGISVGDDTTDVDDARWSKNIVHDSGHPANWKRIDFGGSSCPTRAEKFKTFLESNPQLEQKMGWKHELLTLAGRKSILQETLKPPEEERLTSLSRKYRESILK